MSSTLLKFLIQLQVSASPLLRVLVCARTPSRAPMQNVSVVDDKPLNTLTARAELVCISAFVKVDRNFYLWLERLPDVDLTHVSQYLLNQTRVPSAQDQLQRFLQCFSNCSLITGTRWPAPSSVPSTMPSCRAVSTWQPSTNGSQHGGRAKGPGQAHGILPAHSPAQSTVCLPIPLQRSPSATQHEGSSSCGSGRCELPLLSRGSVPPRQGGHLACLWNLPLAWGARGTTWHVAGGTSKLGGPYCILHRSGSGLVMPFCALCMSQPGDPWAFHAYAYNLTLL